jgi:radical SAM superfamily enzyme YgiQ (UPF0313 family)
MSSLAVHTLWRGLAEAGWLVERAFLDPQPGHTLDHGTSLRDFHLLACTCAYEPDYLNLPRLLEAGGVPALAAERGPEDPLLIAGGPGVTQNPEPLAPLFDLLFIGEVEPVWPQLQSALALAADSREAALEAAEQVPGIYRPDRPPAAPVPRQVRREVDRYPTASVVVTPEAELSDMFLVEIGRGCPQTCKFCLARQLYHPFRPRSLESLLATIRPALAVTRRVGLLGAALSDHPHLLELCETLAAEGARISTSSLRVDAITPRLVEILASGGARTLTLAPETGGEALRRRIGKPIAQEHILAAARAAQEAGMAAVKLYFMVALPDETDADRQAIPALVADLRRAAPRLRLEVALSPLVPKPHTPWEGLPLPPLAEIRRQCAQVRQDLGRQGITVHVGSARGALVQTALSRGGRELGPVLVAASRAGGDFSAVRRACRGAGLRLEDYAQPPAEPPWRVVRMDGCPPRGETPA